MVLSTTSDPPRTDAPAPTLAEQLLRPPLRDDAPTAVPEAARDDRGLLRHHHAKSALSRARASRPTPPNREPARPRQGSSPHPRPAPIAAGMAVRPGFRRVATSLVEGPAGIRPHGPKPRYINTLRPCPTAASRTRAPPPAPLRAGASTATKTFGRTGHAVPCTAPAASWTGTRPLPEPRSRIGAQAELAHACQATSSQAVAHQHVAPGSRPAAGMPTGRRCGPHCPASHPAAGP